MSDIVLGALIGIGGAIVGAIITAAISYINTKSQLDFRIYELRTDRLIKARERALLPLREAVSSSLVLADRALILSIQMQKASEKPDKKELSEAIQRWKEANDKASEANIGLDRLRNQINDSHLDKMITEALVISERESINIAELVVRLHKPESWDIDTVRSIKKELEVIRKRIFDKVLPVNKRIEELLSGDQSS